jgi:hypothetical protein
MNPEDKPVVIAGAGAESPTGPTEIRPAAGAPAGRSPGAAPHSEAGASVDGSDVDVPLTGAGRVLWTIIAIVSGVYIFIPEFTDAIPIIGWIDEGMALTMLLYALERLGVRIPIVHRLLRFFGGRKLKARKKA